jgi:hypothetical protein
MKAFLYVALFFITYSVAQEPKTVELVHEGPDVPLQHPIRNFALSSDTNKIIYITGDQAIFYDISSQRVIAKQKVPFDAKDFDVDFNKNTVQVADGKDSGINFEGDGSRSYGMDFIELFGQQKTDAIQQIMENNPSISLPPHREVYAHQIKRNDNGFFAWFPDAYFFIEYGETNENGNAITTEKIIQLSADYQPNKIAEDYVIATLIRYQDFKVLVNNGFSNNFEPALQSFKYRKGPIFVYPLDTWYEGSGNVAYHDYLPVEGLQELHYINVKTLKGYTIKKAKEPKSVMHLISKYDLKYFSKKETFSIVDKVKEKLETISLEKDFMTDTFIQSKFKMNRLEVQAAQRDFPRSIQLSFSKKEKGDLYIYPENFAFFKSEKDQMPSDVVKIWKGGNNTFIPFDYQLFVNSENKLPDSLMEYAPTFGEVNFKNISNINELFDKKKMGQVEYYSEYELPNQIDTSWDTYDVHVKYLGNPEGESVIEIDSPNGSFFIKAPLFESELREYESALGLFSKDDDTMEDFLFRLNQIYCPDTCFNESIDPLAPALISGISLNKQFLFLETYDYQANSFTISLVDIKAKKLRYQYSIPKEEYYRLPTFHKNFTRLTLPVSSTKSVILDLENLNSDGKANYLGSFYEYGEDDWVVVSAEGQYATSDVNRKDLYYVFDHQEAYPVRHINKSFKEENLLKLLQEGEASGLKPQEALDMGYEKEYFVKKDN